MMVRLFTALARFNASSTICPPLNLLAQSKGVCRFAHAATPVTDLSNQRSTPMTQRNGLRCIKPTHLHKSTKFGVLTILADDHAKHRRIFAEKGIAPHGPGFTSCAYYNSVTGLGNHHAFKGIQLQTLLKVEDRGIDITPWNQFSFTKYFLICA